MNERKANVIPVNLQKRLLHRDKTFSSSHIDAGVLKGQALLEARIGDTNAAIRWKNERDSSKAEAFSRDCKRNIATDTPEEKTLRKEVKRKPFALILYLAATVEPKYTLSICSRGIRSRKYERKKKGKIIQAEGV